MKRNMIKRIAAVAMAGAMMVSMSVPTMAADGSAEYVPRNEITFTKKLITGPYVYVPNATYTFTVSPLENTTGMTAGGQPVSPGEPGGINGLNADNTFSITTTTELLDDYSATEKTWDVGTYKLTVNINAFKTPGVYRYQVVENDPTYEGIAKKQGSKAQYLDVYIMKNGNNLEARYFVLTDGKEGAKNDGSFENTYTTYSVKVTKKVEGNQAYTEDGFDFTFKTTPNIAGEKYNVIASEGATVTSVKDNEWNVNLDNGESATIYGLTEKDAYEIAEKDYSSKGWKTEVTIEGESVTKGEDNRSASGKGASDAKITVTNTKNASTPTGIVMDIAPYIIMVAAAGVLAFVFLRRRSYTK